MFIYLAQAQVPRGALRQLGVSMLLMVSLTLSGCANLHCSEAELAVFNEFPQYGDVEVTPELNADTGACAVYYEVSDSPAQVRDYFVEQLAEHDWIVNPASPAGTLVEAERGEFSYIVYYETPDSPDTPGSRTGLAVHVEEHVNGME